MDTAKMNTKFEEADITRRLEICDRNFNQRERKMDQQRD